MFCDPMCMLSGLGQLAHLHPPHRPHDPWSGGSSCCNNPQARQSYAIFGTSQHKTTTFPAELMSQPAANQGASQRPPKLMKKLSLCFKTSLEKWIPPPKPLLHSPPPVFNPPSKLQLPETELPRLSSRAASERRIGSERQAHDSQLLLLLQMFTRQEERPGSSRVCRHLLHARSFSFFSQVMTDCAK